VSSVQQLHDVLWRKRHYLRLFLSMFQSYFRLLSLASCGFAPDHHQRSVPGPRCRTSVPQTPFSLTKFWLRPQAHSPPFHTSNRVNSAANSVNIMLVDIYCPDFSCRVEQSVGCVSVCVFVCLAITFERNYNIWRVDIWHGGSSCFFDPI